MEDRITLKHDAGKLIGKALPPISEPTIRRRSIEVLSVCFDTETDGSVVRANTIFADPSDFGRMFGQAIMTVADLYLREVRSRGHDVDLDDILDHIMEGVEERLESDDAEFTLINGVMDGPVR